MKILHVLNELKFSGAEIMYVDTAPIFKQLGAELYVWNTSLNMGEFAPFFERAGYTSCEKYIPSSFFKQWKMRKEIIKALKDGAFDAVHVHRSDIAFLMAYCTHQLGIPCVYTYHNVFGYKWYTYLWHLIKRKIQTKVWNLRQTTISDSVYNHELKIYHNSTKKIYNWWGCNRFFPACNDEKLAVRNQIDISSDAFVLVSVGGCSKIKRHSHIIKALPKIIDRYPNVIYLHLGNGNTHKDEEKLAKELGVYEHIRFCGNQTDVRKYLIASDIYIMPSIYEGISITTIEAMACHIPCVLYDVPGLKDFNHTEETAVIIPENYQMLADSVISLYEDNEKQQRLICNAHKHIFDRYYMENNARKIFDLYKK